MAQMTRAEARTAIKTATDHDGTSDTQVTDTQLNAWIDLEHKLFCRELAQACPSLQTVVAAQQTVAAGAESLSMPGDFDSLVRVERQVGSAWIALDACDGLNPHLGGLCLREEGAVLKIGPIALVPGVYRPVYISTPATLAADSSTTGVLLVPAGCEDIIVERVCARVRSRLDEDPTPHLQRAAETWKVQRSALKRRYGNTAQPGLRVTGRW